MLRGVARREASRNRVERRAAVRRSRRLTRRAARSVRRVRSRGVRSPRGPPPPRGRAAAARRRRPLRPPRPATAAPAARAPGVGRPAREPQPDELDALGHVDRGAAVQADEAVAMLGDRPVVGVVERADRLVVRRVVALRVVRAPPEDVAGAPGATRDELAVARSSGRRPRTAAGRAAPGPRAGCSRSRGSGRSRRTARTGRACRRACPARTSGRSRPSPACGGGSSPGSGRDSLCSGTASRRGTGRCGRGG